MAKHKHKAVIGINVGTADGEVRYEPDETIPVEHVEQWMIDDGAVEGPNVGTPASEVVTAESLDDPSLDTLDGGIEQMVEDALAAQAETLPSDDEKGDA